MNILSNIDFPINRIGAYKIDRFSLYSEIPDWKKPIRVFALEYNLGLQEYFENHYSPDIFSHYDVILLSDNILVTESKFNRLINDIEAYASPNTKLIVFWENIVHDIERFKLSSRWRIGTFDKEDALMHNFRYYGFCYLYNQYKSIQNTPEITNDLFFIGIDKGRFSHLRKIDQELKNIGVKTDFIYVDKIKHIYNKNYSSPMPYADVIERILSSKCILDYYQENQKGFTQRLYEAVFYNKKLITNNENVLKLGIYNENNILYIKDDDVTEVADFLNKPFKPYTDSQKAGYQLDSWLDRVINDIECDDID